MRISLFFILGLLLSLAACATVGVEPQEKSGEAKERPLVTYEGETLVVAGKRYERPTKHYPCRGGMCSSASSLPRYQVGSIMIALNTSEGDRVKDLIARYGLSVFEQIGPGKLDFFSLVIGVPVFFEEQWAEALKNEHGILGADPIYFGYLIRP